MLYDAYNMLTTRQRVLRKRNKEIEKKRLELEQEFNRNKLEIEDIQVKIIKSQDAAEAAESV